MCPIYLSHELYLVAGDMPMGIGHTKYSQLHAHSTHTCDSEHKTKITEPNRTAQLSTIQCDTSNQTKGHTFNDSLKSFAVAHPIAFIDYFVLLVCLFNFGGSGAIIDKHPESLIICVEIGSYFIQSVFFRW